MTSISIVTPVFNGANPLRRTLESLQGQAVPFEHIVMDAGSTDDTAAVARDYQSRYPLRFVSEPDEGLYDAVQKGFAQTIGDVMGWINAGDVYFPWTLKVVSEVFSRYPQVEWITGVPFGLYRKSGLATIDPFTPVYLRTALRHGWHDGARLPCVQQESTFWRRSLWERADGAGVLRGQGRGRGYASDYWLWRRFAAHAQLHTVCSVLAAFEIVPGQITDKHLAAYRRECGVTRPVARPHRLTHFLWRLYSCARLGRAIKLDGG